MIQITYEKKIELRSKIIASCMSSFLNFSAVKTIWGAPGKIAQNSKGVRFDFVVWISTSKTTENIQKSTHAISLI